jgi:hypothetical protein
MRPYTARLVSVRISQKKNLEAVKHNTERTVANTDPETLRQVPTNTLETVEGGRFSSRWFELVCKFILARSYKSRSACQIDVTKAYRYCCSWDCVLNGVLCVCRPFAIKQIKFQRFPQSWIEYQCSLFNDCFLKLNHSFFHAEVLRSTNILQPVWCRSSATPHKLIWTVDM